ncbi:hypothetical protein [uncultured Thiocystis sp.]|jgi:hypothetical protein|uniref:hypothetical protein n=1 Tax=uncultured Thiocystis sp. TaxID=1202134 RepID=UPI0025FE0066|nr:hypothetical protein [uncultured Thiocystis sp.]
MESSAEWYSWQLAVGSWQLAVGSWQLAVGSWQLAVGSWQLAVGSWQLAVVGMLELEKFPTWLPDDKKYLTPEN